MESHTCCRYKSEVARRRLVEATIGEGGVTFAPPSLVDADTALRREAGRVEKRDAFESRPHPKRAARSRGSLRD